MKDFRYCFGIVVFLVCFDHQLSGFIVQHHCNHLYLCYITAVNY